MPNSYRHRDTDRRLNIYLLYFSFTGATPAQSKENFMEWTKAQIIDVLSEKNYVIGVDSNPQRGLYQCLTDTQVSQVISVLNRGWWT